MIYTELTKKAMSMADKAHHGQVDKSGTPYIFHPIHLAEQMDDELSCCAALLHDTVEDTDVTLDDIRREFSEELAEIIALLTHRKGQDYFDYVRAISRHPVARKIKFADLAHNTDRTRCVGMDIPAEQLAKWDQKYEKARRILEGLE